MNFSHFLDFLMGLFILIAAIVILVCYAKKILSYNVNAGADSGSINYASRCAVALYVVYAAITAHISFHHNQEYNLSEVAIIAIYLSYIPIFIGGVFLMPYLLLFIFPYYFYARLKYPMLKKCKYFPKETPSLSTVPLFHFLLHRGYRDREAGKIFRLVSELLRTIAICLMIVFFSFLLFGVINRNNRKGSKCFIFDRFAC